MGILGTAWSVREDATFLITSNRQDTGSSLTDIRIELRSSDLHLGILADGVADVHSLSKSLPLSLWLKSIKPSVGCVPRVEI